MRVLIVIDSLGTGGAEKSMVELAKYLVQNNSQVMFVCSDYREVSYDEEIRKFKIPIFYLKRKKFFSKVIELNSIIKKFEPDIIHSVLFRSNILIRFCKLFFKNPVVIQSLVNTPYSKERKKDSKLSWRKFMLAKQLDKWTARIIPSYYHAITTTVLNHYKLIYNIGDNFRIIYRGRKKNNFIEHEVESEFVVINVGRQEFAKGQINLIKAMKYIEDQYGIYDIKLQILGFEGKSSDNLVNYINENNLHNRLEIAGFVRNVEKRLSTSSVFAFPSYYEGLGGALIEAFAAGLPCVCSDLPVLKEVVGDPKGALFCPPGDYKCLGDQIVKLYKDEKLRMALGEISLKRFESAFILDEINKEIIEMYEDCLNQL
jgi:glycosyltransferase involved in cell wall biosynthesis